MGNNLELLKKLAGTWLCDSAHVVSIDDTSNMIERSYEELEATWLKKRRHIFFDRYIKVNFSSKTANEWEDLVSSFKLLCQSNEIETQIGKFSKDTNSVKRSGGAIESMSTASLSLTREFPKGVKGNEKPLTFKSQDIKVSIFPTFVTYEAKGAARLFQLPYVTVTTFQQPMTGCAPRDSKVDGQTWKHVNVSGGSDKRIKNNQKIDIYVVDVVQFLFGEKDISLECIFSKTGCSDSFVSSFWSLMGPQLSEELDNSEETTLPIKDSPQALVNWIPVIQMAKRIELRRDYGFDNRRC